MVHASPARMLSALCLICHQPSTPHPTPPGLNCLQGPQLTGTRSNVVPLSAFKAARLRADAAAS